ncbi:DNA polymeras-like protein subunit delta-2 [Pseudovirgaria hyperparasitica]|uniref:DNA-directed DNA polymerase n=1 Tax=Pseudovirgaria hyperparasitica TaxID=470096 RepID=A0A6A6WBJ1_9PEZI|nr:DNA polymeras-like protein subunit delta-2 [Pseudovirgaria hyperparasitica]KAF2759330.1 DNA polymeras-like protein subunit delta-2 [Pseudovirgaria hyperparasitica]
MALVENAEALLRAPIKGAVFSQIDRVPSSYRPSNRFVLPKGEDRHYQQQYADMYFVRLAQLKRDVEKIAAEEWADFKQGLTRGKLGDETPRRVERVLDVRQGELCWVVGTVFMEMTLKPNVLDDISKEHWIAAPPPREKYISQIGGEERMLEDESGRLRMTGELLSSNLVTGTIIAALGSENADGLFEVIETKYADLPRQPDRWEGDDAALAVAGKKVKQQRPKAGKVAIVSGLSMSGDANDPLLPDLLLEYLLGESINESERTQAASISRLIIAGNSIANASPIPSREDVASKKGVKKYGYDASRYNASPTEFLDDFLAALLPSLPVTLIPGATDPANVAIPQQPLHAALFPQSRAYASPPAESNAPPGWLHSVTNPWEGDIDGYRFLGTGGQPIDDLFKYVPGDDRLEMMENLLRWRCNAPTAPDTLWCYPFQDDDPLLITECPHVYFVGNQPRLETTVIEGPLGQQVTLIAVPKFRETGQLVLLDMESLQVETVQFEIFCKDH